MKENINEKKDQYFVEDTDYYTKFNQKKFLKIISFSKFDSDTCCLFEIYFLLIFLSDYNESIK